MNTGRVDGVGFDKPKTNSYNVGKKAKPDFSKMILAAFGFNVPTLPENFSIGDALRKGGDATSGLARG